ncbi:insecticidal toxin complex protein [Lindgomyces ingoldianus]|uniref:Insecticidal toxin complex protein n=1 Tax=Lindgomyces ingoldianus TaxID=673940 RepID=A0ACB6QET4_9PLEO|nr:insecticidal toxin complex protein [Lindgomyces ingoldianus]KAF2464646.1 insecticidal toxin complex protein [Lindgomyces ingoldianus]
MDRELGSATGLAPAPDFSQPPPTLIPELEILDNPTRLKTSIIQHLRPGTLDLLSMATAVIVIDPTKIDSAHEYPTPTSFDVRFEVKQSGPTTAFLHEDVVDFNVTPITRDLSIDRSDYMRAPTDIYLFLEVPPTSLPDGSTLVSLPKDGRPPSFASLRDAIDAVLQKDQTEGSPSLEEMVTFITTDQAHQIALELIYNRAIDPPPTAPLPTADLNGVAFPIPVPSLEDLYTVGGVGEPDKMDQAREKFEGERTSYYAIRNANALQLANFVFSVVMAVRLEQYTVSEGRRANLDVPVKPTVSHTSSNSSASLSLSGSAALPATDITALDPPFTVPAAFFYALTTTYSLTQDFDTRIQFLITSPTTTLISLMNQAIDARVLNSPDIDGIVMEHTTLTSSGDVTINQYQAIRRIVALRPSVGNASHIFVEPAKNVDVRSVVTQWLAYPGTDDKILETFWTPLFSSTQYLVIILEIVVPNEEDLISKILEDLKTSAGAPLKTVDDLLQVTEKSWLIFFQAHTTPNLLPKKYILGSLADKVHSFVQDLSKILFVASSTEPPPPFQPSGIPFLNGFHDRDTVVQFFHSFSSFSFSNPFDESERQSVYNAALNLFGGNTSVATFIATAVEELWTLYKLTDFSMTLDTKLRFSYMEALHARGLTSASKVLEIPQNMFPSALVGTVAFPKAGDIYELAKKLPRTPADTDSGPETGFQPINTGSLVNCIPPCHLSPFGSVQYLQDLLNLTGVGSQQTLGDILTSRRGDFRSISVTSSNSDLVVPYIDIVNENLESFALGVSQQTPNPVGVVFNTLDQGLKSLDIANSKKLQLPGSLTSIGILEALPQHSTPHTAPSPNAYDVLKSTFATSKLPYSQSLDVCWTYLKALGTSRFETMRMFHKDITELAQDASLEPPSFQKSIWRFPVRRDLASEYLCISAEEATVIFGGKMTLQTALQLMSFQNLDRTPISSSITVAWFLEIAGITYCDFLELHGSGIVKFGPRQREDSNGASYPPCLPCCAESLLITFNTESPIGEIIKLVVFVRLWQRLRGRCGECLSMATLADICSVLHLFDNNNVNPDFLVQLSSLLMLKEMWRLPWTRATDGAATSQSDQQTQLLALWSGAPKDSPQRTWAVEALLLGIEDYSMQNLHCSKRSASWCKIVAENLDDLAKLAGFDGTTYRWDSKPTCTIRFAEVLSKLYASKFTIGEIVFLFATKAHMRGDDPYPVTEEDESEDDPLNVPEDDDIYGLWALRRKLLNVQTSEKEASEWPWSKIEATLCGMSSRDTGGSLGNVLAIFAEHFFPEILEEEGRVVKPEHRRFEAPIPVAETAASMWQFGECSPFHFEVRDNKNGLLWAKLPVRNSEVLKTLRDLRQLNTAERKALQTVYLAPRTAMAPLAMVFTNYEHAAQYMIQEPSVHKRFGFFQVEFARFLKRCRVIAHHLHDAVSVTTRNDSAECACAVDYGCECVGLKLAWKILCSLIADENSANQPWENPKDSGNPPQTFDFSIFSGSAFASLLGLTGTGLLGCYYGAASDNEWFETRGGVSGWDPANNSWNSPIITIIPSLYLNASQGQRVLASFKNGYALNQETGEILSGAEPFSVTWTGVLLIECDGCYHFAAGCPGRERDDEACHCEKYKQWCVNLQRGQKTWPLLSQGMETDGNIPCSYSQAIRLRRGAYDITVKFRQPEPNFDDEDDLKRFHTGFVLKYTGLDTEHCLIEVPLKSLYLKKKPEKPHHNSDGPESKITRFHGFDDRYISTLRDIRRTYQRAFKAILFATRLCLSACLSTCEWESELGYILDRAGKFHGTSYYLKSEVFHPHQVDFNFNFLPVYDTYFPPDGTKDQRVAPSWKRSAAMFDWFERLFDYTKLRGWVSEVCGPPVWLLFHHATSDGPQPVSQLLRFLGLEIALSDMVLEYYQAGGLWKIADANVPANLGDERWVTRLWMACRYIKKLKAHFYAPTIELEHCRPATWAALDGNAQIDGTTGNDNLTRFVQRSCLAKNDAPLRLGLVVDLNNGLRMRARDALLAYIAFQGHSLGDLSDRLLLDVGACINQKTTRIDDAIAAAQRFMQRVILGLESTTFTIDNPLLKRWEFELSSFDKWKAAQRRKYYYENWIQWEEAGKLSLCEGFQSLKTFLGASISTLALPGRGIFWQDKAQGLPGTDELAGVSSAQKFVLGKQTQSLDEGLRLLGAPGHSGRPTWLASLPIPANTIPEDGNGAIASSVTADSPVSLKVSKATHALLPGASSLDHIPLWIQAAVRMGTRFLRVAASSLPIATPYTGLNTVSPCCLCKDSHAPVIDEYYFWLEDARWFDVTDVPAPQNADLHVNTPRIDPPLADAGPQIDPRTRDADPTSDWDAPTPQMLSWKLSPLVHLRWTRVHMGVLLDPRRSSKGIPLKDGQMSDINLDFCGRKFDSLFFTILGSGSELGFRYDIATDAATVLPEPITPTEPPALPLPASLQSVLAAFPYFLYFTPGKPLAPVGTFSTSLVVANTLRTDCRFQEASKWLRVAYDPLDRDNSWMRCLDKEKQGVLEDPHVSGKSHNDPFSKDSVDLFSIVLKEQKAEGADQASLRTDERGLHLDLPCCPASPVGAVSARARAATLEYLETLLQEANTLRGCNSLEASQQALTLLKLMQRVLGSNPSWINATDTTNGEMTVSTFEPYAAPLNPRLIELYASVEEGVHAIRSQMNKRRQPSGSLGLNMAHFGPNQKFDLHAINGGDQHTACDSFCFSCCHPYRFTFVLPKATAWVALAKNTAAAMLSAIEKADTEALSSLRFTQEHQITELGLEISKNNYRAADWDVQALDKQMINATTRLQYFQRLIATKLIDLEQAHVFGVTASTASRTSATIVDGVAQGMATVPDMWLGVAGIMGTPLQFNQLPMGVKMGTGFATAARILNTVAEISTAGANLSLTEAGWARREQDWQHTCDVTVSEIQQIKRQRLAARRRLDNALRELNNNQRRIEHSAEVEDFARDKTSRYELYLYLQQENAALYRQCYDLALQTAQEAQQALRFELGYPSFNFISSAASSWNNLHEGLLAAEKLELALSSLERAHMTKDCREYELVKHVSLRLHFPAAFIMLKTTGCCEVDLPEWLFDLDYPGHYMRRVKSISLSIPCVAGPYTGIHCKLQQLNSTIRFQPRRTGQENCQCCPKKKYMHDIKPLSTACPNDPNVWKRFAGTEAIATSAGVNDSGLFELSFNDQRYLPFEYTGAVSCWRIELPPENNQFDFDSLSDLVMHIKFTAREGGPEFAREGNELAQRHTPGDGLRFFDVRHEMPEVWRVLRKEVGCEACKKFEGAIECICCDRREHDGEHDRENFKEGDHYNHSRGCRVEGKEDYRKIWCNKCKQHHYSHEEANSHKQKHTRKNNCQHHGTKKKRPHHAKREFRLSLTRNMFPFLTSRRGVSVTSLNIILDTKCSEPATTRVHFIPPSVHFPHHKEPACVDTEEIRLVRTESGLLKGCLALKQQVELDDGYKGDAKGSRGEKLVGTFEIPCQIDGRDVCGAWLLVGYCSTEKRCEKTAMVGCCCPE